MLFNRWRYRPCIPNRKKNILTHLLTLWNVSHIGFIHFMFRWRKRRLCDNLMSIFFLCANVNFKNRCLNTWACGFSILYFSSKYFQPWEKSALADAGRNIWLHSIPVEQSKLTFFSLIPRGIWRSSVLSFIFNFVDLFWYMYYEWSLTGQTEWKEKINNKCSFVAWCTFVL